MSIQPATTENIQQMAQLYQEANTCSTMEDILVWTTENVTLFSRYSLVWVESNEVIGAISARIEEGKLSIYDIAVEKQYRNKGIGTKLLEQLYIVAKAENIQTCVLWVHYKNAAVIPFYYRHGFRLAGISQTDNVFGYPDGEDILHLEKKLYETND